MTAEEFRALLARSGGLMGSEVLDKGEKEKIEGIETGRWVNPPASVRVRYTTPNGEITARQKDDGSFEIIDDPKGLTKAAASGDKPIEVAGKLVKPDGKGGYTQVWPPPEGPAGEKPVEVGGRIVQRQPDGTYKTLWEPPAAATKQEDVLTPVARPGAPRPGQRTDLASVIDAANQYQQTLWNQYKAHQITIDQMNQQWNAYYQNTVLPAQQRANQEANDYAATQAQRQHDADVRTQTATDRANEIRQQELEQTVRTGAQTQALGLAKMQVDPSFSPSLAGIYNRIIPGAFQPGAFNVTLPNLDAVADAAVKRAVALHQTTVPPLPTGTGLTATPATRDQWAVPGALTAVPPVGARPGGAVPTGVSVTPANRDAYWQPPVADPLARISRPWGPNN